MRTERVVPLAPSIGEESGTGPVAAANRRSQVALAWTPPSGVTVTGYESQLTGQRPVFNDRIGRR